MNTEKKKAADHTKNFDYQAHPINKVEQDGADRGRQGKERA